MCIWAFPRASRSRNFDFINFNPFTPKFVKICQNKVKKSLYLHSFCQRSIKLLNYIKQTIIKGLWKPEFHFFLISTLLHQPFWSSFFPIFMVKITFFQHFLFYKVYYAHIQLANNFRSPYRGWIRPSLNKCMFAVHRPSFGICPRPL